MNLTGRATILKDDKGVYKIAVANKEFKNDEEQTIFMRINVGFKKGVEVKHKTKIEIKNGFLTFFRIPTGNTYANGEQEYKKYPKIIILDFDVLEEGVDGVEQTKDYSKAEKNNTKNDFWTEDDDDLPF